MPSTMLKQKTTEPAVPDFETAKARWKKIDGERREMLARHEGMLAALSLTSGADTKNTAQSWRDKGEPYLELARRRRHKLLNQVQELHEEIEDYNLENQDEYEIWQAARRRETGRIARELQPHHRAVVKKIAALIEDLSRAMEEEITVRADLSRTAPEATSAYLPNCISGLTFGMLSEWGSPASAWARAMRKLKILE